MINIKNGKSAALVLVLAISLILSGCSSAGAGQPLTFSQLLGQAGQYNGKSVTLEAFYFSGFEISALAGSLEPSSYGSGRLAPGGDLIWVKGGITQEIINKLFVQNDTPSSYPEHFGKLKVTGDFESDGSYGHLNGFKYQISLTNAEILPWSPPTPSVSAASTPVPTQGTTSSPISAVPPGAGVLNAPRVKFDNSADLNAGESKTLNVTLETMNNQLGKVSYTIVRLGGTGSYGIPPKDTLPLPEGLEINIDPSSLTASPQNTYISIITFKTTPKLSPGDYNLLLEYEFENGVIGGGPITVKVNPAIIPPSSTAAASPTPAASVEPNSNPHEFEETLRKVEGYSTSAEVKSYATGQIKSIERDDPRYAEFIKLFHYSIIGSPIFPSAIDKASAAAVTLPYAPEYILTFELKDGSKIWFNCSSENTWYETRDILYRGGFSAEFRAFLEAILADNTGMTSPPANISIQPGPGSQLTAGTLLRSATIRPGVLDKDYDDLHSNDRTATKKGQPCWLITGQAESRLDQDKYMTMVATGYDVNGREVAHVLDHGPISGVISIFLPAQGFGGFIFHLNAAPDVARIILSPSTQLYDIPPP